MSVQDVNPRRWMECSTGEIIPTTGRELDDWLEVVTQHQVERRNFRPGRGLFLECVINIFRDAIKIVQFSPIWEPWQHQLPIK